MPTDKFRQKNPKNKQTKFRLVFDDTSRNDFLTGFQKRKKARKKIALQEVEEKRKKERLQERQKRRDALEEELQSIRLPDPTPASEEKKDVVFDHPEHTVTVTTTLDLQKEHGAIGENQVHYDPEEDEEEEGLDGKDQDNGDDGDEDGDDAEILRKSRDRQDDDEEEEESEDEETTKVKEAKSKKNDILNKRRLKIKKQTMKKKRGASVQSVKRMRSMKKKSLGKFIKRGSANKAKR